MPTTQLLIMHFARLFHARHPRSVSVSRRLKYAPRKICCCGISDASRQADWFQTCGGCMPWLMLLLLCVTRVFLGMVVSPVTRVPLVTLAPPVSLA